MSSLAVQIRLPETLKGWPYHRRINPHYEEVKAEACAWLHDFKAFGATEQRAFDLCDASLITSLANPSCDKERLRTCINVMHLLFVFDEYSDRENAVVVRQQADIIMDALRNPHNPRPQGESVLGKITRQLWERAIKSSTPTAQRRFIESFDQYTAAVVEQAKDRDSNYVRTVDSYFALRRKTIGAMPAFVLLELAMDIPDGIMNHPTIVNLSNWVVDLLILDNDMCSYNVEQACGDDLHNIIIIVMHHLDLDVHGALEWVQNRHRDIATRILESEAEMSSCGNELDSQVAQYVAGVRGWVRANDCWNFESQRYFGPKGPEIQETRIVVLQPQVTKQHQ